MHIGILYTYTHFKSRLQCPSNIVSSFYGLALPPSLKILQKNHDQTCFAHESSYLPGRWGGGATVALRSVD
jgi:hypothetical protein